MTFEQLDCFIAAVECSSFFHAAETLHITQSTLSKQIMKLERELDLTLWDRSRRSAVLTPAGEVFYKEALHLMSEYRKSLATLEQFRETLSQTLRIGTLPILSQYQLSPPNPLLFLSSSGNPPLFDRSGGTGAIKRTGTRCF